MNPKLLIYIVNALFLQVFCVENFITSIIDDKTKSHILDKELKEILEMDFLKESSKDLNFTIIINKKTYDQANIHYNFKHEYTQALNILGKSKDTLRFLNSTNTLSNPNQNTYLIDNIPKKFNCIYFDEEDFSVFDISQLDKVDPSDISVDYNNFIKFKICENYYFKNICDNVEQAYIIWKNSNSKSCVILAGNDTSKKFSEHFVDNATQTSGIIVNFPPGDICNRITGEKYRFSMKFICDLTMPFGVFSPVYSSINFNFYTCNNGIDIKSANACSLTNHFPLLKFLQKYKIFFGAIMIVAGLLLLVWGTRFLEITFVFILGLIGIQIGLKIYENMHIENSNPDYLWIILAISFLIGIGVGYFAIDMISFLKLCLGGYLGYTFSILAYQFLLRYIETTKPELIFWITTFIFIILGMILISIYVKPFMIFGTSLIGSYSAIRGVSLYAGKFPNEQVIFELLKSREFDQLAEIFNGIVIFYLLGWIILVIAGIIIQSKFSQVDNDNKYIRHE